MTVKELLLKGLKAQTNNHRTHGLTLRGAYIPAVLTSGILSLIPLLAASPLLTGLPKNTQI